MQPVVDAIVLTPIAPHMLTNRPIVIPASSLVRVQPLMTDRDELYVTFDGQAGYELQAGDEVQIQCAEAAGPPAASVHAQLLRGPAAEAEMERTVSSVGGRGRMGWTGGMGRTAKTGDIRSRPRSRPRSRHRSRH